MAKWGGFISRKSEERTGPQEPIFATSGEDKWSGGRTTGLREILNEHVPEQATGLTRQLDFMPRITGPLFRLDSKRRKASYIRQFRALNKAPSHRLAKAMAGNN